MERKWPRGEKIGDLYIGASQKLVAESYFPPRPQRALRELEELNKKLNLNLTLEFLPRRFTPIPEEKIWSSIVGVHGPLEGNLRGVLREVFDGAPKDLMARLVTAGVALGIGTEVGPLSLFYRGREIARQMEVYYNLHPDIIQRMGDKNLRSYVKQEIKVLIENGWYDPEFGLSYDPKEIKAFKEKYGIGVTLDTAHAFQVALKTGKRVDVYLREMWEKLDPLVVHFSDRGERDHYPIKMGEHTGLLAELVTEMKKKPGLVVILEIEPELHPSGREGVIKDSLDFINKHL